MLHPDEQEFWNELSDMSRRELAIMTCLSARKILDLDKATEMR